MSEESRNDGTIRLLFEMAREDNPPLYDDLVRFSKGSKRVNRLRLLAHEGLRSLSFQATGSAAMPAAAGGTPRSAGRVDAGSGDVTVPMFSEPLAG